MRKELTHTCLQPSFTIAPYLGTKDSEGLELVPAEVVLLWVVPSKFLFPPPFLHLITKPSKGGEEKAKGERQKQKSWPHCCPLPTRQAVPPTYLPPLYLRFGRGLRHLCSSQTPFLPASTNQIILRKVPAAQVARELLPLYPGRHPWVLQAHPLLQEGRMCSLPGEPEAAQAFSHLPMLRVILRLSGASSLSPTPLPVILPPLVPAAEDGSSIPENGKGGVH